MRTLCICSCAVVARQGANLTTGFVNNMHALGLPVHGVQSPVTIAYGGIGGSYGGVGGLGHSRNDAKPIYNDRVRALPCAVSYHFVN